MFRRRPFTRTVAAAVLAAAHLLAGCAPTPPAPSAVASASLYDRLGGRPAIAALVDDAIGNFATDPRINRRFAAVDPARIQANLVDLLCERAGGPCVYRGHNMADAHQGMMIRDDEFDALVDDVARSFDRLKVPAAERNESLAILRQMRGAIVGH